MGDIRVKNAFPNQIENFIARTKITFCCKIMPPGKLFANGVAVNDDHTRNQWLSSVII